MTPIERFYLAMGFLDCLQMYAGTAPKPEQAIAKRMYIQEKVIPDILPNVPKEEIIRRLQEIAQEKFSEKMIINYMKPYVEQEKMMEIIRKGKFVSIEDLK